MLKIVMRKNYILLQILKYKILFNFILNQHHSVYIYINLIFNSVSLF